MRKWLALWFASLVGVAALTSAIIYGLSRLQSRDFYVLSGADVGYRVEGTDANGKPIGRWMVRIKGDWIEPSNAGTEKRLASF